MNEYAPKSPEDEAQAITKLADGTLSDAERPAIEAWAMERPDVMRQVQRDQLVAQALAGDGPPVPDHLISSIEAKVARTRRTGRVRRSPGGPWLATRWRPVAGALALGAAAVAFGVVLVAGGSGTSGRSITTAASLAYAPATAPAASAKSARLLDVSYGGITYPNYATQFGATPAGQRVDHIDGHAVLTVYYRLRDGSRLSYSIFNGTPVSLPPSTKTVLVNGVPLHVFRTSSGLQVVTLVRNGRTCVLAVPAAHDAVVPYAAWPLTARA